MRGELFSPQQIEVLDRLFDRQPSCPIQSSSDLYVSPDSGKVRAGHHVGSRLWLSLGTGINVKDLRDYHSEEKCRHIFHTLCFLAIHQATWRWKITDKCLHESLYTSCSSVLSRASYVGANPVCLIDSVDCQAWPIDVPIISYHCRG